MEAGLESYFPKISDGIKVPLKIRRAINGG